MPGTTIMFFQVRRRWRKRWELLNPPSIAELRNWNNRDGWRFSGGDKEELTSIFSSMWSRDKSLVMLCICSPHQGRAGDWSRRMTYAYVNNHQIKWCLLFMGE